MNFISHARIQDFRCFGDDLELSLKSLNVFVGPNNSGKSALLLALRRLATINTNRRPVVKFRTHGAYMGGEFDLQFEPTDKRDTDVKPCLELVISEELKLFFASHQPWDSGRRQEPRGTHEQWLAHGGWPARVRIKSAKEQKPIIELDPDGNPLGNQLRAPGLLYLLERLPIVTVAEDRQLRDAMVTEVAQSDEELSEECVDGRKIGWELLTWAVEEPERLRELESKLAAVLGDVVRLVVRPSKAAIEVGIGQAPPRRLADLGAGIASALLICHALVKYDGGILLLEEPELHLHPRLQRNVIRILDEARTSGGWQILVTTHSNHILDGFSGLSDVARFAVNQSDGKSTIRPVEENSIRNLVELLGARAGSLAEANAVVWLEGPSDAIYLRHFLNILDPTLLENVDYSFAFFGGSLLAHQTLSEEVADGMVNLLRIHPYAFLVADRDSDTADELGKSYLSRVKAEAADRVWVTAGREMEDYLRPEIAASQGAYKRGQRDKVGYAKKAVTFMTSNPHVDWLDCQDLREKLERLRALIRAVGS